MNLELVSMPWAMFDAPSAALGALSAYVQSHEPRVKVRCRSVFVDLWRRIPGPYQIISDQPLTGDLVYAAVLYPERRQSAIRAIEDMVAAGIREIGIIVGDTRDDIEAAVGDGSRWGLAITYSFEGRDHGGALETAGGIATAAPLLASERFWVVAGDAWLPDFHFDAQDAADFAQVSAEPDVSQLWTDILVES